MAIVSLGVETLVFAHEVGSPSASSIDVLLIIPFLATIPLMAYVGGIVLILCGVGLLIPRTMLVSAIALGSLLYLCALITQVPRNFAEPGSVGLRTTLFEPLAIGSFAWLLLPVAALPLRFERAIRGLLGVSLIVFGVDHFILLEPIAGLIPNWIPGHVFWTAFFGVAFIAAGLGIGLKLLERWAAACLGLMFAIWVITLHIPIALGLFKIRPAPIPNHWSSLFIAMAMWGGAWALASRE